MWSVYFWLRPNGRAVILIVIIQTRAYIVRCAGRFASGNKTTN